MKRPLLAALVLIALTLTAVTLGMALLRRLSRLLAREHALPFFNPRARLGLRSAFDFRGRRIAARASLGVDRPLDGETGEI